MMDINSGILKFTEETELPLEECAELYAVFLDELHSECRELQKAMEEGKVELSGRIVHNIKGITGNYKMEAIHQTAAKLDLCYKKQITEDLESFMYQLLNQVARVDSELKRFFSEKGIFL